MGYKLQVGVLPFQESVQGYRVVEDRQVRPEALLHGFMQDATHTFHLQVLPLGVFTNHRGYLVYAHLCGLFQEPFKTIIQFCRCNGNM